MQHRNPNRKIVLAICVIILITSASFYYYTYSLISLSQLPKTETVKPFASITNFTDLFYPIKITKNESKELFCLAGNYYIYFYTKSDFKIQMKNSTRNFISATVDRSDGHADRIGNSILINQTCSIEVNGFGYFMLIDDKLAEENFPVEFQLKKEYTTFMTFNSPDFTIDFHAIENVDIIVLNMGFQSLETITRGTMGKLTVHLEYRELHDFYSFIIIRTDHNQNITISYKKVEAPWNLKYSSQQTIIEVSCALIFLIASIATTVIFFYPHIKK